MTNSSLNAADLDGSNGFFIQGLEAWNGLGYSVSSAGDINGDGFDDLIIGAYNFHTDSDSPGKTYVIFGGTDVGTGGSFDLSSLDGTNGFVLYASMESRCLGTSVSDAGDINGDGFADLIIGEGGSYYLFGDNLNKSYVVFGGTDVGTGGSIDLDTLDGSNGFIINADNVEKTPVSVSGAGDVNGDGIDDIIIGTSGVYWYDDEGSTYVVFGNLNLGEDGSFNLSSVNGSNGFRIEGISPSYYMIGGQLVSSAGDVNGDGFADLIIGDDIAEPNGVPSGASYVVFGNSDVGYSGSLDLSTLDGSNGFAINGLAADDRLGRSVSSAGDVNGDGFDDLIIGAPGADPNGNVSGASYVVFGHSYVGYSGSLDLSTLDGSNGFAINGLAAGDNLGFSVSNAGDVNGDGFDDLIIGADGVDSNGNGSSASYVVFGHSYVGYSGSIDLSTLDGSNGFVFNGPQGDHTGSSVSTAGDINSDGFDDLIIGTPYAVYYTSGYVTEESFVVFGSATVTVPVSRQIGTRDGDTLEGSNGSEWFWGRRGDDLLIGGLGSDTLCGGWGNDVLTGGGGSDRFILRAGQGTDTITDFEDGKDLLILTRGLTFGQLEIAQSNSHTLISLKSTNEVLATLTGVPANLITASDFLTS